MTWEPYQQRRLAQEQAVLRQHMPDFTFHDLLSGTYIKGWCLSNSDQQYQVQVNLPTAYPDAIPLTYITYPSPLPGYQSPIESYGKSHAMHTWQTDRPGWVKLCIVQPEDWSAAYSLLKVLRKAKLWIMAYEFHLDDGQPIANFLK